MENIDFSFDVDQVLSEFEQRNNFIRNLDKIPYKADLYLDYISKYKSVDISADTLLFDYEKSLNRNSYVSKNYPLVSQSLWMIAESGQGDEWFADTQTLTISFYDHNQGDYELDGFLDLGIDFKQFLLLGLMAGKVEQYMDAGVEDNVLEPLFAKAVDSIKSGLYDLYPYK